MTTAQIQELYSEIQRNIETSRKSFSEDPADVQGEWNRIVMELDRWLERAIRYNFKCSLAELSKAINGDGKAAPGTIFKIELVLESKNVGDTVLSRVRKFGFFFSVVRTEFDSTNFSL